MGVLDKIKNALFEVEYVEVEEPVKPIKKEKKVKEKAKNTEVIEKPIAKKIVLPEKKEEKIEELTEELLDEEFDVRPSNEAKQVSSRDEFKFMDDNDFKMDEEYIPEEPEIVKVIDEEERRSMNNNSDFLHTRDREFHKVEENKVRDYSDKYYNKSSITNSRDSRPYGMDSSYNVPVHEYGTYDKREERTYFKPSPIISPIYGILDKNYRKEDVVQKKEIRLTTNYTRSNISVDDIRNKAYGDKKAEIREEKDEFMPASFEIEEESENLLVDLSDGRAKPEVKEVTMGDALEYFQDLGLEYNVDYVDASKEKNNLRREKDNYGEVEKNNLEDVDNTPVVLEKEEVVEKVEVKKTKVVEIKDESKNVDKEISLDDDDNLFDLIDSMYQESE